jgi:hypothetical protein
MIRTCMIVLALAASAPVYAQTAGAEIEIVRELKAAGFDEIRITKTWLGRLQIVASGELGTREIVLVPSTGAILRDYLTVGPNVAGKAGSHGPQTPANAASNGQGKPGSGNEGQGGQSGDRGNNGRN